MEMSLILIFVILLATGYFSKRRFGLLTVGLILGYLISINVAQLVAGHIQTQGVKLESPPLLVVTGVALVLIPSIIMAFIGPVHHKTHHRWITSISYAVSGVFLSLLTIAQNSSDLIIKSQPISTILEYRSIILVVIVLLAFLDLFVIHGSKRHKKDK
jgi:drug/metabolite transporter (DMT)-like permease